MPAGRLNSQHCSHSRLSGPLTGRTDMVRSGTRTAPAAATATNHWSNFLLFQGVYAVTLYGVTSGHAWLGALALLVFASWHAITAAAAKADFLLAGIAMVVGFTLDTLYLRSGLISYNGELLWTGAAPLWIVVLWANFALTLGSSLRWLRDRLWLAALLTCAFAPLSYYAGVRMGTASIIGNELQLYALISLTWACVVPLLLWLSAQLERLPNLRRSIHAPAF